MNTPTPDPRPEVDLVKGSAATAKLYMLAVLDEVEMAIHQIRAKYTAELSGDDPFRLLLLTVERERAGKGFPSSAPASAVPVEGSGHPQPVRHGTDGHDGYVSPRCAAGMPGCASRGCICRCHIDTP